MDGIKKKEISLSHKIFYYFYSFNLNFNWIFVASFSPSSPPSLTTASWQAFIQNNCNQMENCTFTSAMQQRYFFPGAIFLQRETTINSEKKLAVVLLAPT